MIERWRLFLLDHAGRAGRAGESSTLRAASLGSSTAMKVAHSLLATPSPQALDTVVEATGAAEGRLVAMGGAEATNSHPSMEEATTTSPRATAPPLHRASASRAIMVKVEVSFFIVKIIQVLLI